MCSRRFRFINKNKLQLQVEGIQFNILRLVKLVKLDNRGEIVCQYTTVWTDYE